MTTETKPLYEKRAALVVKMQQIVAKAKQENSRALTKEEDEEWTRIDAEQESILKDIQRIVKLNELTASETERLLEISKQNGTSADEERDKHAKINRAFNQYLRVGFSKMKSDEQQLIQSRAQSVGTTTAGGFLVPQGFQAELEKEMKNFGAVREVARILSTGTGNDIPWPKVNDTANVGEILSENSAVNDQDITFGSTTLKAYMYSSKAVKVSLQLLQDSAINIDQMLAELLGERLGRITNTHFTTGDNTAKPQGVVTAAGSGKVTASETAFTIKELMDFEHSLDPDYRRNGNGGQGAKFMLHDNILRDLKKLTVGSTDDRPVWDAGIIRSGTPPTILGYQYIINQDMASAQAADAKIMLFGDFTKYIIRDVAGFTLLRLSERYADNHQVGFFAFSRHDGRIISSSNTIKYLINANT